jgi:hypothetical protein
MGVLNIMLFQKNGFSIVVIGLLMVMPVGADIMMNNSSTMTSSSAQPSVEIQDGYWITIDNLPLGRHDTGDTFTVPGKTNLPAGHEIVFGAYLSRFEPGSPDLLPPSYSGSTLVTAGNNGKNTWSFVIDTTQFSKQFRNGSVIQSNAVAGDYTLSIGPSGTIAYPFSLVEKNQTALEIPTLIEPGYPTSPVTQPPTASAPLPSTLPIIALGILGILAGSFRG